MKTIHLTVAAAAFSLQLCLSAWAAPVAMITDLRGTVSLGEPGKTRPAGLLSYLEPGTPLKLEGGSRIVLTYFSKPVEITLAGPAEATVGADGVKVSKGEKPAVRSLQPARADTARKFESVQREKLTLAAVHMRSGARPQLTIDGPIDTAVFSITPLLSWNGMPGVSTYRLLVRDAGGKVVVDQNVAGTSFAPISPALSRGTTYAWRVEAKLPGGEPLSAEARFSVLDTGPALRISRARPEPGASFSERVLFAAQLESEGLRHDARHAWRTLSAERPDDATLREWAERQ
jgi:hypothetical protein